MSDPLDTTFELRSPLTDASGSKLRVLTLVHADGPYAAPKRMALDGRTLVIGRDPGPDGWKLADANTSRRHAELAYDDASGRYLLRDLGSRNGSVLDGKKIEGDQPVRDGAVIRIGASIFVYDELELVAGRPVPELDSLGETSLRRGQAELAADLAARSALPILITGPTGAGKEVMAQRIHEQSGRRGALVVANCATFGKDLIGSELFGHSAGAFSGAKGARSGLFVAADGGTLFLDEIAELPLELQPVLLRALQEQRVRPVGSDSEVAVDVRVIAATHQPLDALKDQGRFRADLYGRLAGFTVELPGLSARKDEVLALFHRFLGGKNRTLSFEAAEALLLHDWPLNVRELKHAAEHAKLFAPSGPIEVGHLPKPKKGTPPAPPSANRKQPPNVSGSGPSPAADAEAPSKEALLTLLGEHGGNVAQVAKALGKHRAQVYRWLRRHEIDPVRFRGEDEPGD